MGWQWGQGLWKHSPYIQVSVVLWYKPILIVIKETLYLDDPYVENIWWQYILTNVEEKKATSIVNVSEVI